MKAASPQKAHDGRYTGSHIIRPHAARRLGAPDQRAHSRPWAMPMFTRFHTQQPLAQPGKGHTQHFTASLESVISLVRSQVIPRNVSGIVCPSGEDSPWANCGCPTSLPTLPLLCAFQAGRCGHWGFLLRGSASGYPTLLLRGSCDYSPQRCPIPPTPGDLPHFHQVNSRVPWALQNPVEHSMAFLPGSDGMSNVGFSQLSSEAAGTAAGMPTAMQ